jgi:hypothetical protein
MRRATLVLLLISISFWGCEESSYSFDPDISLDSTIDTIIIDANTRNPLKNVDVEVNGQMVTTDETGRLESQITLANDQEYVVFKTFPYLESRLGTLPLRVGFSSDTVAMKLPERFDSYQRFWLTAQSEGYDIIPLVEWVRDPETLSTQKVLILQHNVDYDTLATRAMAWIDHITGIETTYHLRDWLASESLVSYLRDLGHEVGFRYNALGLYTERMSIFTTEDLTQAVVDSARQLLKQNILAFEDRFGDIATISSFESNQNLLLRVSNSTLTNGQNPEDYSVEGFGTQIAWYEERIKGVITEEGGDWSPEPLIDTISSQLYPLYVLIHPVEWQPVY